MKLFGEMYWVEKEAARPEIGIPITGSGNTKFSRFSRRRLSLSLSHASEIIISLDRTSLSKLTVNAFVTLEIRRILGNNIGVCWPWQTSSTGRTVEFWLRGHSRSLVSNTASACVLIFTQYFAKNGFMVSLSTGPPVLYVQFCYFIFGSTKSYVINDVFSYIINKL